MNLFLCFSSLLKCIETSYEHIPVPISTRPSLLKPSHLPILAFSHIKKDNENKTSDLNDRLLVHDPGILITNTQVILTFERFYSAWRKYLRSTPEACMVVDLPM